MNAPSHSERQARSEETVFNEFCDLAGLQAGRIRRGQGGEPDVFCVIDETPRYFEITHGTDQKLMKTMADQPRGYLHNVRIVEGVAQTLNKKLNRQYSTPAAQRTDLLVYLEHSDRELMPRFLKGSGLEEAVITPQPTI